MASKLPDKEEQSGDLDCNICFESASKPVVSYCGHVFCWPCIYRWMEVKSSQIGANCQGTCPVCKAAISKDKLVPIYGKDTNEPDPRNSIPPRPPGQYSEAQQPEHVSFSFPDHGSTLMASASFNFNGLGFSACFGPIITTQDSAANDNEANNNSTVTTTPSQPTRSSDNFNYTEFNLGQIFVVEVLRNLFLTLSILTFLFMIII